MTHSLLCWIAHRCGRATPKHHLFSPCWAGESRLSTMTGVNEPEHGGNPYTFERYTGFLDHLHIDYYWLIIDILISQIQFGISSASSNKLTHAKLEWTLTSSADTTNIQFTMLVLTTREKVRQLNIYIIEKNNNKNNNNNNNNHNVHIYSALYN